MVSDRGLAGRDARGVDDAGDIAQSVAAASASAWTESREETSTVVVLTSNPASASTSAADVGVLLAQVGEHDVLSSTDPSSDGLTDLTCSDDDDDFAHRPFPSSWSGTEPNGDRVGTGTGDVTDDDGAVAVVLGVVGGIDRRLHVRGGLGEADIGFNTSGEIRPRCVSKAWRYHGRFGPPADRT